MALMVIVALLAVSNPTVPAVQQPAAAPVTNPEMVKEKKICRADHEFTGTRMRKQVCLTKSEWQRREGKGGF